MIFILTIFCAYILYRHLRKRMKNEFMCFVSSYFIATLLVSFLTLSVCTDGWGSMSIGSQGACSHHGGVTTKLNATGGILFVCSLIYIIAILTGKYKSNKVPIINRTSIYDTAKRYDPITRTETDSIYRVESRELEQSIRCYCYNNNITFNMNHEIYGALIISRFKFKTEEDLNKVLNHQS